MKRNNHLLGGILLIAGTSVGAGMLALPVITSFGGFIPSFCLFTILWALMLATAFFFLNVNLAVKGEPNFISMTGKTLGKPGKIICWIFYLLLLYALLAAYISACAPLFSEAFSSLFSVTLPSFVSAFFLPILFAGFIYLGTKGIDYINRILMIGLILSYVLLTGSLPVHMEPARLIHGDFFASLLAAPVILTSFGYHIIIPTLTTYMGHRAKLLRKTILIGSIIPFIIYVVWQAVVLGAVPLPHLTQAWADGVPATEPLSNFLHSPWIGSVSRFFSFFAIITSFLGISLSLSDFLTDGLKIKKTGKGRCIAIALTFVPPLLFIFSYDNSFYIALDYAGSFVAILLGILPCLMVLRLKNKPYYQSFYGKAGLYFIMLLFSAVVVINLLEKHGVFTTVLSPLPQIEGCSFMFRLQTSFEPKGDQPQAIQKLTEGILHGKHSQVLLGITGSGKTFTMANVIAKVQKPTLILAHNKTLAAQLYQEFKNFFPDNAVEYFVSYYDYYQPEAYIARTDTYIEKDLAINDQIDRMRLSATRSLLERDDVIIVSSISCIYGLGTPEYYKQMKLHLQVGQEKKRDDVLMHLVSMQYTRNEYELVRSTFRSKGDVLDIMPAYEEDIAYRIEFFGDTIDRITRIDPLTGRTRERCSEATIFPGSHHVTPEEVREDAVTSIKAELKERLAFFETGERLIEKQRIGERTAHDLEMIKEIGFCKGIENYSRHFSKRSAGDPSPCLIDYFPDDYLLFIDESHQTLPQARAMYNGDRARKNSLIEFGFRLPSAYDNRPLQFEEFFAKIKQVVYVSATPAPWEVAESGGDIVEQVIRPTGLLDPEIEIRPVRSQVDNCLEEIRKEKEKKGKVLVTTLTKKLAEDLSSYLNEIGVKAKYLHSDIDTLERVQIINELRNGIFDVLVGINLLREGLDIPEVSLVVILDADKEGFLRSETALIQNCGRASRNVEGRVIMYADKKTKAIENTVKITSERRKLQQEYNTKHGIIPKTTRRNAPEELSQTFGEEIPSPQEAPKAEYLTAKEIDKKIKEYESAMKKAAKELRFEEAGQFRDLLRHYQHLQLLEENL